MKEDLRRKYLIIRRNVKFKSLRDKIIYLKIIKNKLVRESKTILTYVSTNEEVDTINIIKYLLKTKKVAVPKIENNTMNFYYIKGLNDLEKGYFNIFEPITDDKVISFENTVSLTPGVCFSEDLYRIGYGKGFYDKFYRENNIYSIGLCYKKCLVRKIDIDKHDIKVNEIITD